MPLVPERLLLARDATVLRTVLDGVSHWIPEQEPEVTTEIIVDRIAGPTEATDAP